MADINLDLVFNNLIPLNSVAFNSYSLFNLDNSALVFDGSNLFNKTKAYNGTLLFQPNTLFNLPDIEKSGLYLF